MIEASEFYDLQVGSKIKDRTVTRVFNKKNGEYVFYEFDHSGKLEYRCKDGTPLRYIHNELGDVLDLLGRRRHKMKYIGRIADAMKDGLLGKIETAKEKLKKIKRSIEYQKAISGRLEYLGGTIVFSIFLALILLIVKYFHAIEKNIVLIEMVLFGLAGGILSVTFNLKAVYVDILSNNKYLHLISGASRSVIAGLSALTIYILIKADLLLGVVKDSSDSYILYAFAIISGFVENYVPNLLKDKSASLN